MSEQDMINCHSLNYKLNQFLKAMIKIILLPWHVFHNIADPNTTSLYTSSLSLKSWLVENVCISALPETLILARSLFFAYSSGNHKFDLREIRQNNN